MYTGLLFNHNEESNYIICSYMDRNGNHYVKWNKPHLEGQSLCLLSYVQCRQYVCMHTYMLYIYAYKWIYLWDCLEGWEGREDRKRMIRGE
jgi:hypothetical protein